MPERNRGEVWPKIRKKLEPLASEFATDDRATALYSIAISLKRIADILDKGGVGNPEDMISPFRQGFGS